MDCSTVIVAISTAAIDPGINADVTLGEGVIGGAIGAFFTTLVVAALLIVVSPAYTERTMNAILDRPFGAFLHGFALLIALILAVFLLAVTGIGILFAIPLLVIAYVVWAVGAAIAYLAIADRLVGHEEGWLKPVLVAAAVSGALAATGVGAILSFAIGAAGVGAVLGGWLD